MSGAIISRVPATAPAEGALARRAAPSRFHLATHQVALSRRVGVASTALIPIMLCLGMHASLTAAREGGWAPGGPFADSLAFMVVPLSDLVMFAVFVALALAYRRHPALPRRFMLLATLGGSRHRELTGGVPSRRG